ncbi:MAG: DNA methyltransferase [Alphaproteobacteria bacterium GM7ARS4]|nr:DNA methyltransferase [Alphaproteobacteria bacterium GM7ARS4]
MTTKINDLDLEHWKAYDDIVTDSLWLVGGRDRSGAHNNAYHGNFIPQIPYQMMRRYTKRGDVVLDTFLGHGTTLIEAKRLGRHGIGLELSPDVACQAQDNIARQSAPCEGDGEPVSSPVSSHVIVADSTTQEARDRVQAILRGIGSAHLHLIIMHPPYHDIIAFSDKAEDISNAPSVEEFTKKCGDVVENFVPFLDHGRYLAIVIGDKYTNSAWVPLGFYLMQEALARGDALRLKAIVVKNMTGNRAKIQQDNLWRYRALTGGFYIFKHEYILLFQRT